MFIKQIELFKLFGFAIKIDLSWFIIVALVTWSLAKGVFPNEDEYKGLSESTYWIMGLLGTLGLFASVVFHELAHALVARRHDMPMRGITLFIFGGVAEMTNEPPTAKAEFQVAIAGPIASVFVAAAAYGLYLAGAEYGWPAAVNGVFWFVGWMNAVLVAFNMVPAFPLDGGRVLRSALWHFKGNLKWATRITSAIGSGFGLLLILLGILTVLGGGPLIGGLWWVLIGLFLRGAASMSYRQLLMRRALEGETVERFMSPNVVTVPPDATIDQLVEDYIYKHHHKIYPVASNGRLMGCITTRQVKQIPREEWDRQTVQEVLETCSTENTISPCADAMQAFSKMSQNETSRLMVVENGELRGIISLKDLMKFISLKVELEEEERRA